MRPAVCGPARGEPAPFQGVSRVRQIQDVEHGKNEAEKNDLGQVLPQGVPVIDSFYFLNDYHKNGQGATQGSADFAKFHGIDDMGLPIRIARAAKTGGVF